MKEFRFRIFIILAFLALSVYLLYPTYQDYDNSKSLKARLRTVEDSILNVNPTISKQELRNLLDVEEEAIFAANPDIKSAREKRIKLGLDLQGGMYLTMEVNTAELLKKLAKDPDDKFNKILAETSIEASNSDQDLVTLLTNKLQENGIRLSRYFGSIRDEDGDIISKLRDQEADAVTRAKEIINNRVNQYGVSEPSIQQQGARRIIVELPGVAKEQEAKKLLQGSALLEFKLVKEPNFAFPIIKKINEVLASTVDTTTIDTVMAQEVGSSEWNKLNPFYSVAWPNPQSRTGDLWVKEANVDLVKSIFNKPEVKSVIPDNVEFVFSAKPEGKNEEQENIFRVYLINKIAELTGGVVEDAQANIDPQTTQPIVNMVMNGEGSRDWARITGSNVGKRIAIVLDGFVYTAPVVNGKIPSGRSQIEGSESIEEAKLLEIVLKAGALPAPIDIIEERTVGPSLGEDSINQGLNSTLIGFGLVAVFMILYYRSGGGVADLTLLFTILFIMGILSAFKATLTLPGIAGIILTIGMAVDANVLIYERIREELRTGKTMKAAVDSGFVNSYSAIFDSNITTFFTGIILYQFGSGAIQGFALTLMIGIVCSLFSAMVVTRLAFEMMIHKGNKLNLG